MKRPFSVIALMACLLAAPTSFGSNQWRLDELGVGLQFPEHWHLTPQSVSGDLAKGGLLLRALRTPGVPAGVLLIQSCMPSAILCYLIAHMYSPKEIVDNISSTIVVSTIMSLFTIPITLFFALKYFY